MADMHPVEKKFTHESIKNADVDTAYGVYEDIRGHEVDAASQRSLLWKIDLRLMPLM